MKIKMLKDDRGHEVTKGGQMLPLKVFKKGEEYEVDESLGKVFVSNESAELVKSSKAKPAAPENKEKNPVSESKGKK